MKGQPIKVRSLMGLSPIEKLDNTQVKLLDRIQDQLPLAARPFRVLGEYLGLSETDTLLQIKHLKELGFIKFMGGIINTKAIGFSSLLVAFKVRSEYLDLAVDVVNSHPGVSHNYLRDDPFNMWFTLATPPHIDIIRTAQCLFSLAKAQSYLLLPTKTLFKIGLVLDLAKGGHEAASLTPSAEQPGMDRGQIEPFKMDILRQIQFPLSVVPEPFKEGASELKVEIELYLKVIKQFLEKKILRRWGAILAHKKVGYTDTCMVVWEVDNNEIDYSGKIIASYSNISHCYHRSTFPEWPYALYSVIHAHNSQELEQTILSIEKRIPCKSYKMLRSTKELKKKRLVYFSDAFDKWESSISSIEDDGSER